MNSRQKRASFALSFVPCFFLMNSSPGSLEAPAFYARNLCWIALKNKSTSFRFQHVAFLVIGYDNVIHKITHTFDRSITQRVFLALSALYTFSRTQVRIVYSRHFGFLGAFRVQTSCIISLVDQLSFFSKHSSFTKIFPISGHDSHRWYQSWTALRRFLHSTDTQVWRGGETFTDIERSRVKGIGVFLAKCLFRQRAVFTIWLQEKIKEKRICDIFSWSTRRKLESCSPHFT